MVPQRETKSGKKAVEPRGGWTWWQGLPACGGYGKRGRQMRGLQRDLSLETHWRGQRGGMCAADKRLRRRSRGSGTSRLCTETF